MDSDDKKITQLARVTSLSDSDLFVVVVNVGTAPATKAIEKSNAITGGGGGLTTVIASITTANLTATAGQRDSLDVSGMTANRNWILTGGGEVGDEVEVALRVGDDTYALIIIGDTGVTITAAGVTTAAATEWSRLFITGESLKFVKTSTTNWQLVHDGRVKQIGVIEKRAAQSINNITDTKIQFATNIKNVGDVTDIATNYRITIRRAGVYNIQGYASLAAGLDDNESVEVYIYVSGVLTKVGNSYTANAAGGRQGFITIFATLDLAAGAYIELNIWHNEGAAVNTNTTYYPQLAVVEVF